MHHQHVYVTYSRNKQPRVRNPPQTLESSSLKCLYLLLSSSSGLVCWWTEVSSSSHDTFMWEQSCKKHISHFGDVFWLRLEKRKKLLPQTNFHFLFNSLYHSFDSAWWLSGINQIWLSCSWRLKTRDSLLTSCVEWTDCLPQLRPPGHGLRGAPQSPAQASLTAQSSSWRTTWINADFPPLEADGVHFGDPGPPQPLFSLNHINNRRLHSHCPPPGHRAGVTPLLSDVVTLEGAVIDMSSDVFYISCDRPTTFNPFFSF